MQFIYLHGFNSNPNALKAQRIKEKLRSQFDVDLYIPNLNLDMDKRINLKNIIDDLTNLIDEKEQTVFFSSSFGCFLAVILENTLPDKIVRSYLISPFLYPHLLCTNSESLPNYFQKIQRQLHLSNPDFEIQLKAYSKFQLTNTHLFYIGKNDTQIFLNKLCEDLKMHQLNYVLFNDSHEMIASFDHYWTLIEEDLVKILKLNRV